MKRAFILIVSLCFIFCSASFSQGVQQDSSEDAQRVKEMLTLSKNIDILKQQIRGTSNRQELEALTSKLKDAEAAFDDVATDSDLFTGEDEPPASNKDVWQELQDVLKPMVMSLKKASEKPRRIEQLRNNVSDLEIKINDAQEGITSIDQLIKNKPGQAILERLKESRARTAKIEQDLKSERDSINDQLKEELKSDKSFWSTSTELIGDFFSTKGKNLFYALITSLAVFGILILFKRSILRPLFCKDRFASVHRPIMALYGVLAIFLSVIAGLLCLFMLNDWFLFSLIIVLIGLAIWGFKHLVVNLFSAVKIVFDLGTVREGQRIMLDGCPWLVKKVGLQTVLHNEALHSGDIRVSVAKIKDHTSRPVVKDEPWFPTNHGDYVLLSDGTYGEVTVQTPEQVVITMRGETKRFYSLSVFMAQAPKNLSHGFEIHTSIDVDYNLQPKIRDVLKTFKVSLMSKLKAHKISSKIQNNGVSVQFGGALSSSLNIITEVRFKGEMASHYFELKREIDSMLVDICTKNKFNIPYKQLSVHISN